MREEGLSGPPIVVGLDASWPTVPLVSEVSFPWVCSGGHGWLCGLVNTKAAATATLWKRQPLTTELKARMQQPEQSLATTISAPFRRECQWIGKSAMVS